MAKHPDLKPLTGSELLKRVSELGSSPKSILAIECGYYTSFKSPSGQESKRANVAGFYDALLTAQATSSSLENKTTSDLRREQKSSDILTAEKILELYSSGVRDFTNYSYSSVSVADELMGADLRQVNFSGLDFSETNLDGVNLSGAVLIGTDFIQSTFNNANLKNANFTAARFNRGSIRYSDLTSAKLNNADLQSTDLVGNNLTRVDLTGVNLEEAWSELNPEFNRSIYNLFCDTIMPDGRIYSTEEEDMP